MSKIFEWFFSLFAFGFYLLKSLSIALSQPPTPDSDDKSERERDIDNRIQKDKLFNKQNGILKDDLAKGRDALNKVRAFGGTVDSDDYFQTPDEREANNEAYRQAEPLKAKGDSYEKFIGKQFERNGDLVIYSGFIKGFDDKGVDLMVISSKLKAVNLIQCKNWTQRSLTVEDIENIYSKLNSYSNLRLYISDFRSLEPEDINFYLDRPKEKRTIFTILESGIHYKARKTLYIASDKVVDLAIGQYLTMVKPNIFKYKDMKMVVKGMH